MAWFAGLAIAFIITSVVFRIGWQNKEEVLLWGYAVLSSASIFSWGVFSNMKKGEKKELDDKLKEKANISDIESLNCQMRMFHETLELIAKSQEEVHSTVDSIWGNLMNKR